MSKARDIADGIVKASEIEDGAVTAAKLASGAAVSNIGYTPVNTAGDTINGDLSLTGRVTSVGSNISSAVTKLSGTYSAGTEYDIGWDSHMSWAHGVYVVTANVDTYNSGGGNYDMDYSTVPFMFKTQYSNNNHAIDLPQMYGIGHAPNGVYPGFSIRLRHYYSADATYGAKVVIRVIPNVTFTNLIPDQVGQRITLTMRKIG